MKEFVTVNKDGKFEEVINKSRFLSRAYRIESEEDVQKALMAQKKEFPDARHHCWAYILGEAGMNMRYSDDGEPQGTAGQPMLEVIKKQGLTNTLVVVTRYFGGILLGAGGLARAYTSGAVGALKDAGTATFADSFFIDVTLEYTVFSKNEKKIRQRQEIRIDNIEYLQAVTLHLIIKAQDRQECDNFFVSLSDGRAKIEEIKREFVLWEL